MERDDVIHCYAYQASEDEILNLAYLGSTGNCSTPVGYF
jgi:hypothetical protein